MTAQARSDGHLTSPEARDPDLDMPQRSVTREVPRLSLRAMFEPSTANAEKRTVDLTWTTGSRVMRGGMFSDPYLEELSLDPKHVRMDRLQSGAAPLLNSHRSDDIKDVLGVVESARLEKGKGTATVRFDSGPEGEDAFRRVREGTLRNISVGYATHRMQKIEDSSSKVPVYRAVDWEPHELTLTSIGADAGAVTRSAGGPTSCEFIEERAMPSETETTTTTPAGTNTGSMKQPTSADGERKHPDAEQVRAEERTRITGIHRVGRSLKRPEAEIADAVDKGMHLDAYRAAAIDAHADAPGDDGGVIKLRKPDLHIEAGADERDKYLRSAENWILVRSGLSRLVTEAAAKTGTKVDLDPGHSRGMTLVEMARDCLERTGVKTRGMDVMKMIGEAFTHRSGGMNSSSDFSVVLENTLNKTLLAAFAATPDTWRSFAAKGVVSDFRPHNRYRQGSFGVLDLVNEGGEYKNASVPDGTKNAISAQTKGRIVALTRQAIINDDLGAFSDIATRLGRAAALTVEVDVYATLAMNGGNGPTMGDGYTLYHANHNNIGTGSALSVAGLDADRVLLGSQQDANKNEYLELRPTILLLPLGLGGQARVINGSQYDTDALANARNQVPNKVVGLFSTIIDTARISGTTRYLFANPDVAPALEVVFLNGNETPYLETMNGWRVDGTEWKVRLDYGVGARDWIGTIKNPGA